MWMGAENAGRIGPGDEAVGWNEMLQRATDSLTLTVPCFVISELEWGWYIVQ